MKYCNHCRIYVDADICPYCGSALSEMFSIDFTKWILFIALMIVAVFCVKSCNDSPNVTDYSIKKQLYPRLTFDKYCMIKHASSVAGIDDNIEFKKIRAESNFTSTAVSKAGALGDTQVMPFIAGHYRLAPWRDYDNILCGAMELKACYLKAQNYFDALCMYNAGKNKKRFSDATIKYAYEVVYL